MAAEDLLDQDTALRLAARAGARRQVALLARIISHLGPVSSVSLKCPNIRCGSEDGLIVRLHGAQDAKCISCGWRGGLPQLLDALARPGSVRAGQAQRK